MLVTSPNADLVLPADLIAFHSTDHPLYIQHPSSSFEVAIRPLDELTLEHFPIAACSFDCFARRPESVDVDVLPESAVNLATLSEGEYDTVRHLLWLPEIRRFVIWDSLDNSVRVFGPRVTWSQIVASPFRHLKSGPDGELHLRPAYVTNATDSMLRPSADRHTIQMLRGLHRMTLRDRVILVLMASMLFALGFMLVTSELPAISRESYEEIRLGMDEGEVRRIMRAWPGLYRHNYKDDGSRGEFQEIYEGTISGNRHHFWGSGDGWIIVYFDQDGKVEYKLHGYCLGLKPSHPERWPWWKRFLNRRLLHSNEPSFIYTTF